MKKDIANFVGRCLTCQQVKASRQRRTGLLQPINIPQWKWGEVSMDFISGLPKTRRGFNVIWVIVDRLTKIAHFISGKSTFRVDRWAQLYVREIVHLHGVPTSIVSDRDVRFTSHFWKSLQKSLGTQLRFSTAFHPQIDGKTKRLNQVLEDMLRACVVDFAGYWDEHLPLMKFAYNNSNQATIQMASFEAFYGRRYRTLVFWEQVGTQQLMGLELVQVTNAAV